MAMNTTQFLQTKLSRSEWSSLEMPMSKDEIEILNLLKDGFNNVNLYYNNTLVIQEFLKIQNSEEMNIYIYKTFIEDFITKLINKYNLEDFAYEKKNLF